VRLLPIIILTALTGCLDDDYAQLYASQPLAPSLTWNGLQTLDYMGAYAVDDGVQFTIYSENAERLELLLFDDPDAPLQTKTFLLERDGNIWTIYIEAVGVGQHYGFRAWGPNWTYDPDWFPGSPLGFVADVDMDGNRFNPNKVLTDPYTLAVHRPHDWSLGSAASGPDRTDHTVAAAAKSVIVASDFVWSEGEAEWRTARASNEHEGHQWEDLIVYETHVKGYTQNPMSGVDHPGTYQGMGEKADYLQDLGVNAVELLPIHQKEGLTGGYWGYSNLSYFVLESSYSANFQATGRSDTVIDEFKQMVQTMHEHDIEVIVDVVYNHTGEGGLWRERLYFETFDEAEAVNYDPKEVAGIYSYRGLDNAAYYALEDDPQYYIDTTGVGNTTRPNHTPMKRIIMDSLHYMVEELHVDGFRFDLAGVLGEKDLDYYSYIDPTETILQEIIDDPILQAYNTRIMAEPWTVAGTGPGAGGYPVASDNTAIGWGEWNGSFRVWWRSFVNNCNYTEDGNTCNGIDGEQLWGINSDETGVNGGSALTGSQEVYGWNDRKPYHTVNYVTVHDGMTMYDLFSYDERQNGCGLLSTICCETPKSVWCDPDEGEEHNRSLNLGDEPAKRAGMRSLFSAMLLSHGTPLLYGGDEWMRTQFGNNNAWSDWSDNEWNWFRWGEWTSNAEVERYRMRDFVRELIKLRKRHKNKLAPAEYGGGVPFTWRNASNLEMSGSDWDGRHLAIHYESANEPDLLVLLNYEGSDVTYTLPAGKWSRLMDTQSYFDDAYFSDVPLADPYTSANITLDTPEDIATTTYTAKPASFVVLEGQ
jgi:glycogen operon protein